MNRREFIMAATVAGSTMMACSAACAAEAAAGSERKACANKELNEKSCTCANTSCRNHGVCCQCVFNHRAQKNKPACLR